MAYEVALRDMPPTMEYGALVGPTHSPVLDAMTTMEERERIEADYEWFRYSKFALPFLIFVLLVATVLFCLTVWHGGMSFQDMRDGTPRIMEQPTRTDDHEAGIPKYNRKMRTACFVFGFFGLAGIVLTMYLKPAPAARKGAYFAFAFLGLFICGVLAAIAGGMDAGNVNDARWCRMRERGTVQLTQDSACYDMSKMMVAITVVDLALAVMAIITALALCVAAVKSFSEPKDDDEFGMGPPPRRGVTKTTRQCLLLLLAAVFVLLTLQIVFTILLHEGRDMKFADETYYTREGTNYKTGWPLKNTRLRLATTGIVIIMVLLNLIPFRSRVFAYICGFIYFLASGFALMCFALDVKAVNNARDETCPFGWDCFFALFITTCFFDILLAILLVLYVVFEFIARLLMECRHCTRNFGFYELNKHEAEQCSSRPVHCEVCSKNMKAKEFVYEHRFECGHDAQRCEQCGTMCAVWGYKKHQEECPKWPVKCEMCDTAFARADMPAHVAACTMTPASCEGCGETFRSADLAAHVEQCSERQVQCSRCHLTMPMFRFESHADSCM
eukprot:NODE_1191_length_1840_cov_213.556203_g1129_i1.p1 GENE.NODE_1191_length_1840_cov_213.556203_g1129_i1~~NODE_1191_length_1840_cov_213.556203_g1129_i1.p1  ORF type:complete len:558 (+),score=159.64 NODE_1191_length_1840_cov_213.556203_g1129_i1:56-1729(+)